MKYWDNMSPAERKAEMQRRIKVRHQKANGKPPDIAPTEIVNQIMNNPDTFLDSIDTAIQSQRNKVAGLKGEIEQAERTIGRLENFRASLEFADNRQLPGRSSLRNLEVSGEDQ